MNKFIIATFAISSLFVGIMVYKKHMSVENKALYTIGILQTATHPALDAARKGFIAAIQEKRGNEIRFVVRNGEGSISNIHTIAQQFHAKKDIKAIFAIATPAAQTIISMEKEKPICIAAASVNDITKNIFSAPNVYGVSDMINLSQEIYAMKILLPTIKTVGILYCTAETNSFATSQFMSAELKKIGLEPLLVGVTSEAEIGLALMSALRKVDALLTPTDNMVANGIGLITDMAAKASKPLIVSDNMLVRYGALMSRGVDYYESGKKAGLLTLDVLFDSKKPKNISIISVDNKDIFINKQVCDALNVVVPESLMKDVIFV